MNIRTPVCDMLGIARPIFGLAHSVAVVAEISRCGGYGVYGAARDLPEDMPGKLAAIGERLGSHRFGVDIILPRLGVETRRKEAVEEAIPAAHRAFVEAIRAKYAVPPATVAGFRSKLVRSDELWEAQIEAALTSNASMFACGAGVTRQALERAKKRGKVTAAVIGTPRHARAALEAGADILVAQGYDAGGHTGTIGTMTLVPQIVEIAGATPVLAAGGIGSGRQVAASLAMGAQGVWLGTLWLATREHALGDVLLGKLLAAESDDTVVTRASSGKTMRQVRTAWSDEWSAPGAPEPLKMPYQDALVGDLVSAIDQHQVEPLVHEAAGQSVAWCREVTSVRDVFDRLLRETDEALSALRRFL